MSQARPPGATRGVSRLFGVIASRPVLAAFALLVAGLAWVLALPFASLSTGEAKPRGSFIDENAVSVAAGVSATPQPYSSSDANWALTVARGIAEKGGGGGGGGGGAGAGVGQRAAALISSVLPETSSYVFDGGKSAYGILPETLQGHRREAIVLSVPADEPRALALALSLTRALARVSWLSKRIVVVAEGRGHGAERWLAQHSSPFPPPVQQCWSAGCERTRTVPFAHVGSVIRVGLSIRVTVAASNTTTAAEHAGGGSSVSDTQRSSSSRRQRQRRRRGRRRHRPIVWIDPCSGDGMGAMANLDLVEAARRAFKGSRGGRAPPVGIVRCGARYRPSPSPTSSSSLPSSAPARAVHRTVSLWSHIARNGWGAALSPHRKPAVGGGSGRAAAGAGGPNAPFLRRSVDALTLTLDDDAEGDDIIDAEVAVPFMRASAALVRTLSDLDERPHVSFSLYLLLGGGGGGPGGEFTFSPESEFVFPILLLTLASVAAAAATAAWAGPRAVAVGAAAHLTATLAGALAAAAAATAASALGPGMVSTVVALGAAQAAAAAGAGTVLACCSERKESARAGLSSAASAASAMLTFAFGIVSCASAMPVAVVVSVASFATLPMRGARDSGAAGRLRRALALFTAFASSPVVLILLWLHHSNGNGNRAELATTSMHYYFLVGALVPFSSSSVVAAFSCAEKTSARDFQVT